MLLTNAYDPDPRVRQEALSLIAMGCRVRLLAWDRDQKRRGDRVHRRASKWSGSSSASTHGRGPTQILFYVWVYAKMFWRGWQHARSTPSIATISTRCRSGSSSASSAGNRLSTTRTRAFPTCSRGAFPLRCGGCWCWLENWLIRRIDLLITVGEKLRRHLDERGARRSVVVGNWKRLGEFSRSHEEILGIRRRLGVPDDGLLVTCITQLLEDRKIDELLAAAAGCPDVYVILAGTGVLKERVTRAATENPRIIFAGFVSGPLIADYTCAADVIFYGFDPSNPNARFSAPNKLYEALAAGRPLITGDFGEIADVVRSAQCGIVLEEYSVPEIKKAFAILRNHEVRRQMADNAARTGRASLHWEKAEQILFREYSTMLPGLRQPQQPDRLDLNQAPAVGH